MVIPKFMWLPVILNSLLSELELKVSLINEFSTDRYANFKPYSAESAICFENIHIAPPIKSTPILKRFDSKSVLVSISFWTIVLVPELSEKATNGPIPLII
jgi:hypothetical protein